MPYPQFQHAFDGEARLVAKAPKGRNIIAMGEAHREQAPNSPALKGRDNPAMDIVMTARICLISNCVQS